MAWLILAAFAGVIAFFLNRAWGVWQSRFGNRGHEFDAAHLALLMAERDDDAQAAKPTKHVTHYAATGKLPAEAHKAAPIADYQPIRHQAIPADAGQPIRRKPLLDTTAQDVFLHLRTDLPGNPLLTCVDIATLLDPHGPPPPRMQADFVICKKDFTPAVVIFLDRGNNGTQQDHVIKLLSQHRMRVLRWRTDALPSREQMRHQIFKPKAG